MCCVISCILKCILGFVISLLMIVGIVLGALGALLLWGFPVIIQAISSLKSQLASFLASVGINNDGSDVINLLASNASVIGAIAFAIGVVLVALCILMIVGLCCCSAKLFMIVIVVILCALTLGLLVLVIFYSSNPINTIFSPLGAYLQTAIVNKYVGVGATNPESIIVNIIQVVVKCCGLNNYTDFNTATNFNRTYALANGTVIQMLFPNTCCDYDSQKLTIDQATLATCMNTQYSSKLTTGCWTKATTLLTPYLNYCFISIGVTIGVLVAVIIALILFIICMDKTP